MRPRVHERRLFPTLLVSIATIGLLAAAPVASARVTGGGAKNGRRDTLPPTVTITTPTPGATLAGTVTVPGTASDAGGISSISVSIDAGSDSPARGTHPWPQPLDTTRPFH